MVEGVARRRRVGRSILAVSVSVSLGDDGDARVDDRRVRVVLVQW